MTGIVLGSLSFCLLAACQPVSEYRGPGDIAPAGPGEGRAASRSQVPVLADIPLTSSFFQAEGSMDSRFAAALSLVQDADRMMIYSASMGVEVARVEDAIRRCLEAVEQLGGYLSSRANATLTCRLPAARFEELLAELRTYGRVLSESMRAQDVTREHVDLGIRLDNARRSRERLLELLERAEAVEDILKIEQELRRLTEEIERMEGELRYLEDQVAMSTVTVVFQAVAAPGPPDGPRKESRFPWINMVGADYVLRWF